MSHLTPRQRKIVSSQIRKEFKLQKSAIAKRQAGKKLSDIERRRIGRPQGQLVKIGFEKAREIDETIPEFREGDLD